MKSILITVFLLILTCVALLAGLVLILASRPYPEVLSPLSPRQNYINNRFPSWAFETIKVGRPIPTPVPTPSRPLD